MSRYHVPLLAVVALVLAVLFVSHAAPRAAAQDPDPAAIVAQLAEDGIITSADGELVVGDIATAITATDPVGTPGTAQEAPFGDSDYTNIVAGTTIGWSDTPGVESCGFVLRAQDDNTYYFARISRSGIVEFSRNEEGHLPDVQAKMSMAIAIAPNATNTLLLSAEGNTFTMLVNGEVAGRFTEDQYTSGTVGLATYKPSSTNRSTCTFLDTWLWDRGDSIPAPAPTPTPTEAPPTEAAAESTATPRPAQGKPATTRLTRYNAGIRDAVAELEELGIIPSGGSEIFREPMAFFEGTGNWFTPLASYKPYTQVVMAGELTFTPSDSGEPELCTLMARTELGANSATTFLEVGLTNTDVLIVVDIIDREPNTFETTVSPIDLRQPQHILFTAMRDRINVYLNGELVMRDIAIDERAGTYGIALTAKGVGARCEGSNIWAWEVDDVVSFGDSCGVRAGSTVNLRSGPGTNYNIAGTLEFGQTALIIGQATAADGYVWYKLDNDAWVRSDVITQGGDCTAVPEINE